MIYIYVIEIEGKYIFRRTATVSDINLARKFNTRILALNYARRYLPDKEYKLVKISTGISEPEYIWK
ncbi:MAG: hypothetical protein E7507_00155 [Ruminococcus sp.]|nr:hypothetical protein [Ruminococcus sp.]